MGDRIGQHQTSDGHDKTQPQSAFPEHDVHAPLFRLHDDIAVFIPLPIHRIQVIDRCLRALHRDHGVPEGDIPPSLVGLDHGFLVWAFVNLFKLSPGDL